MLLRCRERGIDAKLRALRTSEVPTRLEPGQLQALLAQCMGMQEAAASALAV